MKNPWFKSWGWIYRPVHPGGFLLVLAAAGFCANVFWALDRHSHSVSDTLYHFYPYAAPTFLGLLWLAGRASAEARA